MRVRVGDVGESADGRGHEPDQKTDRDGPSQRSPLEVVDVGRGQTHGRTVGLRIKVSSTGNGQRGSGTGTPGFTSTL